MLCWRSKRRICDYLPAGRIQQGPKRARAYRCGRDVLWAIWGTASENGGSKVIKTAPKELKEKYQQVFA